MQSWTIEGGSIWYGDTWREEALGLADGRINNGPVVSGRRFDARNCLVLPGMIDLHGDAFERQWMPRASAVMPLEVALPENDRQLIANGITTAFYSVTIGFEPGLRSLELATSLIAGLCSLKAALSADSPVHLRFETRADVQVPAVQKLIEQGDIQILSFNDHVADQLKELEKPGKRETYFARSGLSPIAYTQMLQDLVAQDDREIDERIAHLAGKARQVGIKTMMHDPLGVGDIDRFAQLGCNIAEFPMDEAAASRAIERLMPVVMGSPNVVRGGSHKGLVGAEDLVRQGLCNVLTSDYYYPAMLAAVSRLARADRKMFGHAWNLVSCNAADAAGLADRGRLCPGKRGDVIILRLGQFPKIEAVFTAGRLCYLTKEGAI